LITGANEAPGRSYLEILFKPALRDDPGTKCMTGLSPSPTRCKYMIFAPRSSHRVKNILNDLEHFIKFMLHCVKKDCFAVNNKIFF
jgi:hypothetical protein